MAEISAYLDAAVNLVLGFMMIVVMGFMLYLLSLALSTMVRNKQPRWDAIVYVIAILVLGLAMWRYFPQIAIKTMRLSMQDARPEADLLQEEIRRWIPRFEVTLPVPTPTPTVFDPLMPDLPSAITNTPPSEPAPTLVISATVVTVTLPPATATPYPTYTPWPTPTPLPTVTPCLVQLFDSGDWVVCPPTPVLGGG